MKDGGKRLHVHITHLSLPLTTFLYFLTWVQIRFYVLPFIRSLLYLFGYRFQFCFSLQDLVCKTFYEFWFEEPSGSERLVFGDGSSVPLEVAKRTEQIVEMLRRMPNHQLLVTVIKRNLALDFFPQSAKAAGINPVSLTSVRKRCELMCKCLLEKILQVLIAF